MEQTNRASCTSQKHDMQDAFFVLGAVTATARVGEPRHQIALKDVTPDDAVMWIIGVAIVR